MSKTGNEGTFRIRSSRTDKSSAAAQDEKSVDRADFYILLRFLTANQTVDMWIKAKRMKGK